MTLKNIIVAGVFVFVAFKVYQRTKHPWRKTAAQSAQNGWVDDEYYSL